MKKYDFSLQPFQPANIDVEIKGEISRRDNRLIFRYELQGDLKQLEVPDIVENEARKHELWKTTCFELFLGIENSTCYWEFNISPSGNWNIYRFDDYRAGMEEEDRIQSLPCYIYSESHKVLLGTDGIDIGKLADKDQKLNVSITTVVKEKNGNFSYWALKHCGEEPDFHLRDSFVLDM